MTISTHHAENVIKAYTKQQRTRSGIDAEARRPEGKGDSVTLSTSAVAVDTKFERISYNLIDILTRKKPLSPFDDYRRVIPPR